MTPSSGWPILRIENLKKRYYVHGGQEPIIRCFRNNVPYLLPTCYGSLVKKYRILGGNSMNIATNLERSAFYFPDRPAVSEDFSETSYARLNDRANRVATTLIQIGVKPGDHVGLCA
ncbi:MAG: AMP-binding protein, partial [Planctomycetota bacterium]